MYIYRIFGLFRQAFYLSRVIKATWEGGRPRRKGSSLEGGRGRDDRGGKGNEGQDYKQERISRSLNNWGCYLPEIETPFWQGTGRTIFYACTIWYDKSDPIRFTFPEFVGDMVHNDRMIDSLADIQSSPIEKSMRKKHNGGATTYSEWAIYRWFVPSLVALHTSEKYHCLQWFNQRISTADVLTCRRDRLFGCTFRPLDLVKSHDQNEKVK